MPLETDTNSALLSDMPSEFKKLFNSATNPDLQSSVRGSVSNEMQAREQEDFDELSQKYFQAKWEFYVKMKLDQLEITKKDLEEAAHIYDGPHGKDAMFKRRAEFMYSYFDYDNDRSRVRERFINDLHKKITLKEIGEQLDKFLLDERAEGLRFLDITKDDKTVKSAAKDSSNFEMSWTGRIFKDTDPLKPNLLDDASSLDGMPEDFDTPYRDILDRIKHEDERTDYSRGSLSQEQKTEIALFHSFKQDPYFKHFLYNHLRQFSEDQDEGILNFPEGPFTKSSTDFPKFDRINLYDFRRALPQKEREAKLDGSGAAWGFGKRKTSHAVVRVKPGKGLININGMSMLDYFTLPS